MATDSVIRSNDVVKRWIDNDRNCFILFVVSIVLQISIAFFLHVLHKICSNHSSDFVSTLETHRELYIFQTCLIALVFAVECAHMTLAQDENKRTSILSLSILANSLLFYLSCSLNQTPVVIGIHNREFLVARNVQWGFTCILTNLVVYKYTALEDEQIIQQTYNTVMMLVSGAGANYFTHLTGACCLFISFIYGYRCIYQLFTMLGESSRAANDLTTRKIFTYLQYLVTVSWCVFPVIWLFSFKQVISVDLEAKLYMLADAFAKLLFTSSLQKCNYHTVNIQLETQLLNLKKINEEQSTRIKSNELEHLAKRQQDQKLLTAFLLNSLGNPLAAISMCVSQIKKDINHGSTNIDMIQILKTSVQSASKIVADVLNIQKLDAGTFDLESNAFSLQQVLGSIISQFSKSYAEFEFNVAMEETIPILIGDNYRLAQIITIILQNAIDFSDKIKQIEIVIDELNIFPSNEEDTDDTSTNINITKSVKTIRKTMIKCSISDFGSGITDSDKSKIFTAFSHIASQHSKKISRTGLSLSMASKMIQRMNGSIGFNSTVHCGTTFTFELPFEVAENQTLCYTSASGSNSDSSNRFFKPHVYAVESTPQEQPSRRLEKHKSNLIKILLIDDDNIILKLLKKMIVNIANDRRLNIQIFTSKSVDEAIHCCNENSFVLIIIDHTLLGPRTGIDFVKEYKDHKNYCPNTTLIGATSNIEPENVAQYMDLGTKHVYAKPLSKKNLCEIITLSTLGT